MRTQKRGSTYYSRIVVPSSLRPLAFRREVVKSLNTRTYSTARLRCAEWEARLYGLLAALEARGEKLSRQEFEAELQRLAEPTGLASHTVDYSSGVSRYGKKLDPHKLAHVVERLDFAPVIAVGRPASLTRTAKAA